MMRLLAVGLITTGLSLASPNCFGAVSLPGVKLSIYTERDDWIESRVLVIDDGESVALVGATSSEYSAKRLLAAVEAKTHSGIKLVLLDSSATSKSGGAAVFAAAGIEVWASRETAQSLRAVESRYAAKRSAAAQPASVVSDPDVRVFDTQHVFPLAGGSTLEIEAVPGGCNSNGNSIVRLRNGGAKVMYVGNLVQSDSHPWFSGSVVDGVSRPDLARWQDCVDALISAGAFEGTWYSDEGQKDGPKAARAFSDYLAFVLATVQNYLSDYNYLRRTPAAAGMLPALSRIVAEMVAKAFPTRTGQVLDLQRSLEDVLNEESRRALGGRS